MKAGTKFIYRRVTCPDCGKWVAENWIIRHKCEKWVLRELEKDAERNELREEWLRKRLDEDGDFWYEGDLGDVRRQEEKEDAKNE